MIHVAVKTVKTVRAVPRVIFDFLPCQKVFGFPVMIAIYNHIVRKILNDLKKKNSNQGNSSQVNKHYFKSLNSQIKNYTGIKTVMPLRVLLE